MNQAARATLVAAIAQYFAVPADEAELVLSELEPVVCRGGDWLFRQGDSANCLYLLARGRMQVWLDGGSGGEAPRLVAEVEPGETIGEIGMLTGGTRSAGVRAVRNSLLLRMTSAAYDRLARRSPELTRRIAGGIAERLRDRTAGISKIRRTLKTIAVVPLGRYATAENLVHPLAAALRPHGDSCIVTAATLRDSGAPLPSAPGAELSPAMVDWLSQREDEHRFVFYVPDTSDPVFTDVALHHADLILLVADSTEDATLRSWERQLLDEEHAPVARRALVLCHPDGAKEIVGTGAWLSRRDVDFHLHVRAGVPNDLQRLARVLSGNAVGLVLGGGAARGFAHIGVYRAMYEAGMPIDWLGGSSIGAVMAAGMATGLDPKTVTDRARIAFVDGKPFGDVTLPIISFLRGRRMERLINEHLAGHIEDLPLPFFCVSSNLGRGTVLVHDRGAMPLALRASVSLPGIFPPAVINNQFAVDGGILDNLPVDLMRTRPVGRVVAVDLSSERNYTVSYPQVPSPWRVLAGKFLPFSERYRVPGTVSVMLMAMSIGAINSARSAAARADILIRPPVGEFSFTDVRAFDRIVEAGYRAANEALQGAAG